MKKYIILFIVFAVSLIMIFLITELFIGANVHELCGYAQKKYNGDCVEALIKVVENKDNGFETRNSAIWALGQLGDERSLPVVKYYYIGYKPEKRCDRLSELCQYELYKALKLLEGGFNVGAWVWR